MKCWIFQRLDLQSRIDAIHLACAVPQAFVSATAPEGIVVGVDHNLVAAELRMFPELERQLEALVPSVLSDKQFWVNYFSHKHGIKISVAEEAERLAASSRDEIGFIQRPGASAHLRQQFVDAMRDSGVHLKLHQGSEASDIVLWLKTPEEFAWSTNLAAFPPQDHFTVAFFDIQTITAGKKSGTLLKGTAKWADPECCFSIQLTNKAGGGTLDFEAGSSDEACTFLEGASMLIKGTGGDGW